MKTASKVFLILNLVWRIPYALIMLCAAAFGTSFGVLVTDATVAGFTVGVIYAVIFLWFVPGIIFDFVGLAKLSKALCKQDVPTWLCICVLIFGDLLAGIFMLCATDKDFAPVYVQTYVQNAPPAQPYNGYYPGDAPGGQQNPYQSQNPYQNQNQNLYQNANQGQWQQPYQNANPNGCQSAARNPYQNANPNQSADNAAGRTAPQQNASEGTNNGGADGNGTDA